MLEYCINECATFRRTKEALGGLSNMAGGFMIRMGDIDISRSEHLYQALRFPAHPRLQQDIIAITNPVAAKRYAHMHLAETREDWPDVRVPIMLWCLQLKLLNNPITFGDLLQTAIERNRQIVEVSHKDDFWGAKPVSDNVVRGQNVLGRLLWTLGRLHNVGDIDVQPLLQVHDLRLFGENAISLAIAGLTRYKETFILEAI